VRLVHGNCIEKLGDDKVEVWRLDRLQVRDELIDGAVPEIINLKDPRRDVTGR